MANPNRTEFFRQLQQFALLALHKKYKLERYQDAMYEIALKINKNKVRPMTKARVRQRSVKLCDICRDIKERGIDEPAVLNKDGSILLGHHRAGIAYAFGMTMIPYIYNNS